MKVVILPCGFGTRISEESHLKSKPMIWIGEKPILWHIMKAYSHYGFNDFTLAHRANNEGIPDKMRENTLVAVCRCLEQGCGVYRDRYPPGWRRAVLHFS